MTELSDGAAIGRRILFISNGHGEDLNASLICAALREINPSVRILALPIVGQGKAYVGRGVALLLKGRDMPSGGMVYQGLNFWKDIASGWIQNTLAQIRAVLDSRRKFDLVMSVGDHVPLVFAWLAGRPTMVFLVSTSSFYEGRLKLSPLTRWLCDKPFVLNVFTRDAFTAADLVAQGLKKARFVGYPIMDVLQVSDPPSACSSSSETDLDPSPYSIGLLPGSRFPEAQSNLALMLRVCRALAERFVARPWTFEAAIAPGTDLEILRQLIKVDGWDVDVQTGVLRCGRSGLVVNFSAHHFSEILIGSSLILGMAGTAVEQAVGLGKPVVQLIGSGPQFTYAFAEAQMRLLGKGVFTVGRKAAGSAEIEDAATLINDLLHDPLLPEICHRMAQERVGAPGGSQALALALLSSLPRLSPSTG